MQGGVDLLARTVAIYGAAVATAALLWNVYVGLRDRSNVKVKVAHGFLTGGPNIGPVMILIEAMNKGRRPVTLTSVGFTLPDGKTLVLMETRLPVDLTEGKSHTERIPHNELRRQLIENGYHSPPTRAWFGDATGRKHESHLGQIGKALMETHFSE
jgi:hypothetical protein